MKIVQIHDTDLIGRNFNGYDLQCHLNKRGIDCRQIVKRKSSNDENVIEMVSRDYVEQQLLLLEEDLSVNNLFPPYCDIIQSLPAFQEADIVHYHMIHHYLISIFDFPKLLAKKKNVLTIHDPWFFTGHCVHPLSCENWKNGCGTCERLSYNFKLETDNSAQMWKLKQKFFSNLNADIVVTSNFMKSYLSESPFTKKLTRIHKIPFGINLYDYTQLEKYKLRREKNLPVTKTVVGFRLDDNEIKGCRYIWEMLSQMEDTKDYIFACIGKGNIPEYIREKVHIIEVGWTDSINEIEKFHTLCDIFLMPSLAESFGVMAIEAMAAKSTVVCFKNTVLEEIVHAPECGIAVAYGDSMEMLKAVSFLHENREEIENRGEKARAIVRNEYNINAYVDKHIELYEEIMHRPM